MPWTFSFFCLPRLKRTKKGSCTNEIGAKNVKETMVARTMHVAYTSRYKTHNEHLNHIECLFWVHLTYAIRTKKKYTAKIAILLSSAYTTTEFHSRLLALFPCWTKLMILSTYMIYFFFFFAGTFTSPLNCSRRTSNTSIIIFIVSFFLLVSYQNVWGWW